MPGNDAAILVLGGSGQVGTALTRRHWPPGIQVHAPSHRDLEITSEASIAETLSARRWSCVINCAAYTAVDAAESDAETAWLANAKAPLLLAAATNRTETPLIHLSTDYVFDGEATSPYRPSDAVCPLNVYGRSKAAGEDAVRTANPQHLILRTSWLSSPYGKNFVKTMLALAERGPIVKVVNDQFGRPTSAIDLAEVVQAMALRSIDSDRVPFGTYHFANAGRTTWYDMALEIMSGARRRGAPAIPVEAIPSSAYRTAAARPRNSELCTIDLTRDFEVTPRPWQIALEEILDDLIKPAADPSSA